MCDTAGGVGDGGCGGDGGVCRVAMNVFVEEGGNARAVCVGVCM